MSIVKSRIYNSRFYIPAYSKLYGFGRHSNTALIMAFSIEKNTERYDGVIIMDPRANPKVCKKMKGIVSGKIETIKKDERGPFVNLDDMFLPLFKGQIEVNSLIVPGLQEEILVLPKEKMREMLSGDL
jgi:hypothetical protein|tara:strand:- start:1434 stop:1817 length:384 start_codon:yes stop_codon:yes gene_type:complete